MWQREQKSSISEPDPLYTTLVVPLLNVLVQPAVVKGLITAFGVPSGGVGMSQSPSVEVRRATSKNAPRHPGSRHAFDIMAPFHWFHRPVWHPSQPPTSFTAVQSGSSNGWPVCGAPNCPPPVVVSLTTYGAGSGIRLVRMFSSPCRANTGEARPTPTNTTTSQNNPCCHCRWICIMPSFVGLRCVEILCMMAVKDAVSAMRRICDVNEAYINNAAPTEMLDRPGTSFSAQCAGSVRVSLGPQSDRVRENFVEQTIGNVHIVVQKLERRRVVHAD